MKLYEEIKAAVEWQARSDSRVELIQDDLIQELYLEVSSELPETASESHMRQMIKTRLLSVGKRLFRSLFEREGDVADIDLLEVSDESICWGVGVSRPYQPDWPVNWQVKDAFAAEFQSAMSEAVTHFHSGQSPNEETFNQFLNNYRSPLRAILLVECARSLSKKTSPVTYTNSTLSNSLDCKEKILRNYRKLWEQGIGEGVSSFEDGVRVCTEHGISVCRALLKPNTLYFNGRCPLCRSKTKRLFLTWRETDSGYKWNSNCYKCRCKHLRFSDGSRTRSCFERFLAMALA